MRMLVQVKIPNEEFNAAVRDGSVGRKMGHIMEETKAESIYFTERDGCRGAVMVVDISDSAKVPAIAEPWFLVFNASVEFHVCMTPDDFARAGIDQIAKKWS